MASRSRRASERRVWLPFITALSLAAALGHGLGGCRRAEPDASADRKPVVAVDPAALGIRIPSGAIGPVPFVLWLHGLGSSGEEFARALGVPELASQRGFAYAAPDGALDSRQRRFWDATEACCNFDRRPVDHVAELGRLISAARAHPAIDPARIYLLGYSNGGFMAHRLACELEGITAIASVAGAGPTASCMPAGPVAVLQAHGDADDVVRYAGGRALDHPELARHPSAQETVAAWGRANRCTGGAAATRTLDLDAHIEGSETIVASHSGCAAPVELWTIRGGTHSLRLQGKALGAILDWLLTARSP
jgi:polyhydroxybutyrate depolymerase